MKTVPVVRLSHLSKDEKRAYVLADNKLAELAGYDREILAIELQHLIDVDFDVELTGFETAEIDLLMEDAANATAAEDEAPPYGKEPPVSQAGDLWMLGEHLSLLRRCPRCRRLPDADGREKAEFVFTDAPYNLKIEGHVSGLGRIRHGDFAMASGEMSRQEFTEFLRVRV